MTEVSSELADCVLHAEPRVRLRMSDAQRLTGGFALHSILALMLATITLCWPAFLNGGAFFFPDTTYYLRSADAVVNTATGWQSAWSDKLHLYHAGDLRTVPNSKDASHSGDLAAPGAQTPLHPVLLGRSVYYGLAIFPFVALLGSIGAVILQAALAVFVIWVVLRTANVKRRRLPAYVLTVTLVLACLTSLPFYASLIMPDMFAGSSIALAVAAMVGWERLVLVERAGLVCLLCFGAMAHSTHVLVLLMLLAAGLLLRWQTGLVRRAGLAAMLAAVVMGFAGDMVYSAAVTHRFGQPPIRLPFLTARLINEGPGLRMLHDRCGTLKFEACRFIARMPRASDEFLFSQDPRNGVFSVEPLAVQRTLAGQDFSVALATLRYDPLAVIGTGFALAVKQLTETRLDDMFNSSPPASANDGLIRNLPPTYAREVRATRYAAGTFPLAWMDFAVAASSCVAAGFLLLTVFRFREQKLAAVAAGLVLLGVIANAAVTGPISSPHDRFNVRVLWVLPLAALSQLIAVRERKRKEQGLAG